MFALSVELLMGRAVITRVDNREEPEWPPHPDRIFMALVAGWGETDQDEQQRAALEWLESQGAPSIRAALGNSVRTACISYVPVNDSCSPISKKGKVETPLGSLALGRARNGRSFSTVVPHEAVFSLVWPVDLPDQHRRAMESLCAQVTYFGHSATPVRMWVEPNPGTPELTPTEEGAKYHLRVPTSGRTATLVHRFEANLRPLPAKWQGYIAAGPDEDERETVVDGPFDPGVIVLRRVDGRSFTLESCGMIADCIRRTLMKRHGDNPPEWLTGHALDGSPSRVRRIAYLPLAFVGREHADRHLLGFAIAVPRDSDEAIVKELFHLLGDHGGRDVRGEPLEVEVGSPYLSLAVQPATDAQPVGQWDLELDETNERNPRVNLRPSMWTGPARVWSTVTPIILPRFPRRGLSAESVVAQACVDAGYPEPTKIYLGKDSIIPGVPHAKQFHRRTKPGIPPRPLMHTTLEFANPLRGPVILGAGRYMGFGFCRPHRDDSKGETST